MKHEESKLTIRRQGKVIVERDADGFLAMLPNGQVIGGADKKTIEQKINRWLREDLKADTGDVGVAEIEWRL